MKDPFVKINDCKCGGMAYIRYLVHNHSYFIACYECSRGIFGREDVPKETVIKEWNEVNSA